MNDVAQGGSPMSNAILPTDPPKDPLAALLLNLFFVFVGYFVIGQWQKGIAGAVGLIVELVVAFGIGLVTAGCGACMVIPVSLAMHGTLAADCYLQAQVLKSGHPIGQWTFFNGHL